MRLLLEGALALDGQFGGHVCDVDVVEVDYLKENRCRRAGLKFCCVRVQLANFESSRVSGVICAFRWWRFMSCSGMTREDESRYQTCAAGPQNKQLVPNKKVNNRRHLFTGDARARHLSNIIPRYENITTALHDCAYLPWQK